MGTKVELEHTNDEVEARKIAADHLAEQVLAGKPQDYYSRLKKMESDMQPNTKWTQAYINDLPDSAFFYVGSGGEKRDGRTHPLELRKLPYKNKAGNVDSRHLHNALSRLRSADIPERERRTSTDARVGC